MQHWLDVSKGPPTMSTYPAVIHDNALMLQYTTNIRLRRAGGGPFDLENLALKFSKKTQLDLMRF